MNSLAKVSILLPLLLPAAALAHPGHAVDGLGHGFSHPFGGLDHLLAMITVGAWAALQGGKAQWQLPLAFLLALLAGSMLGLVSGVIFIAEPMVILSLLAGGIAMALWLKAPSSWSIAVVALFGLFHGQLHGVELPAAAAAMPYIIGMAVASLLLHLAGVGLGRLLLQQPWLYRTSGLLVGSSGLAMVLLR
jgi:urease accessory protein